MLFAFYISLIPVINLETSFIGDSQSDRYGYLPSIFFIILFVYLLNKLFDRKILFAIITVLVVWFYAAVQVINTNWSIGNSIVYTILKTFQPATGDTYVINLPDNYNGTYMLRTGFSDGVSLFQKKNYTKQIKVLSYHPIQSINDSVRITQIGESTVQVELLALFNRFYFMEKLFVKNPNPQLYTISEYSNKSFVVQFNKLKPNDKLYYYSRGKLNRYTFDNKKIGA